MRTTTIFAETHTSERANHVAYRLVYLFVSLSEIKRLDWFAWHFQGRCGVTVGRPDCIFGQFRETDAQHGAGVSCAFAPQLVDWLIDWFIYLLIDLFILFFIFLFIYLFIYLLIFDLWSVRAVENCVLGTSGDIGWRRHMLGTYQGRQGCSRSLRHPVPRQKVRLQNEDRIWHPEPPGLGWYRKESEK